MFRTYAGHSTAKASNELYRQNLAKGPDGAFGRFRPADPDRLRLRPPARPRRGRQGRRADLPSRRHAGAVAGHPARRDEHLDDHQCHRGVAACRSTWRLPTSRASTGASSPARCRTTSSRNISRAAPMCSRPTPSLRLIKDVIVYTSARCRNGTRPMSAPTICRRLERRRRRSLPLRSPRPRPCSTR